MSTVTLILLAVNLGFLLGWLCCGLVRSWRQDVDYPQTRREMVERYNDNGLALFGLARELRVIANGYAISLRHSVTRADLRRWARVCEQATIDHLRCINAIGLDSLAAVGEAEGPVDLGAFVSGSVEKRA